MKAMTACVKVSGPCRMLYIYCRVWQSVPMAIHLCGCAIPDHDKHNHPGYLVCPVHGSTAVLSGCDAPSRHHTAECSPCVQ
jgi:hypothetical protein